MIRNITIGFSRPMVVMSLGGLPTAIDGSAVHASAVVETFFDGDCGFWCKVKRVFAQVFKIGVCLFENIMDIFHDNCVATPPQEDCGIGSEENREPIFQCSTSKPI